MFGRNRRAPVTALGAVTLMVLLAITVGATAAGTAHAELSQPRTVAPAYTNPLPLDLGVGRQAINCADPFVLKGPQAGDPRWYLYCTSDAIDPVDPDIIVTLPMYTSVDMVHWSYAGNALPRPPKWVGGGSLWAPDVVYHNGSYLMYYTASDSLGPAGAATGGGAAIGVMTSASPLGPWADTGKPVIAPQTSPYPSGGQRWVFDPDVLTAGDHTYLYYGSFGGGVSVRELSADGLSSVPSTDRQITLDNRYEGTFVIQHDGWYYLTASATNCCVGPRTGYAVFAGRSRSPLGPFLDRDGVSLLATRVGGTPVLTQNGNQWVGPGGATIVTDFAGQQWIYYHAVDVHDPYVPGQTGYTRRQLLVDPLDWQNDWPTVNGGAGASATPLPGPAAQPGQRTAYQATFLRQPQQGPAIAALSDGFAGTVLSPQWTWVRAPAANTYQISNGTLTMDIQNADLQPPATDLASVLTEPAPTGGYLAQTCVGTTVPDDGSTHNYVQGGLVIYNDDGNYVKLAVTAMWDSRQTEFGEHLAPVPSDFPAYGNTVDGPVGPTTCLRIVHATVAGADHYTAYTSLDGQHWDAGGTWDLPATDHTRIGLVAMGGAGYTSTFRYVLVSRTI